MEMLIGIIGVAIGGFIWGVIEGMTKKNKK